MSQAVTYAHSSQSQAVTNCERGMAMGTKVESESITRAAAAANATPHMCASCGADPSAAPSRVARVWRTLTRRLPGRAQKVARDGLIAYAALNLVGDVVLVVGAVLGAVGLGAYLA